MRHKVSRRGQGFIEVTVIIALVVVAAIVTVSLTGGMASAVFSNVVCAIQNTTCEGNGGVAPNPSLSPTPSGLTASPSASVAPSETPSSLHQMAYVIHDWGTSSGVVSSIVPFNLATKTALARIDGPDGFQITSFVISADASMAYASASGAYLGSHDGVDELLPIDLLHHELMAPVAIPSGDLLGEMAIVPGEQKAYALIGQHFSSPPAPHGAIVSLNLTSLTFGTPILVDPSLLLESIVITADGTRAYVLASPDNKAMSLLVLDLQSETLLTSIVLPNFNPGGGEIVLAPDGQTIYATAHPQYTSRDSVLRVGLNPPLAGSFVDTPENTEFFYIALSVSTHALWVTQRIAESGLLELTPIDLTTMGRESQFLYRGLLVTGLTWRYRMTATRRI